MRALLVMAILLAPISALGDDDAEATRTKLQGLLEARQYSEALRVADAAVSEHPGDVDLHYRYGLLLSAVNDHKRAVTELEVAHRLLPDEPAILGDLARLYYDLGDEKAARESAVRLAELAPGDQGAKGLVADLDARDRIRARRQPDVSPDTPAAVVHATFELAATGHLAEAIDRHLAPALLAEIGGGAERAGFVRGLRESAATSIGEFDGFEVEPAARVNGATSEVDVRVLYTQRLTREAVDQQLTLIESPLGQKALPAEVRDTIAGLEPADRRLMFERLVGAPRTLMVTAVATLVRDGDSWKIADLVLDQRISLREVIRSAKALSAAAEPANGGGSRYYRLGYGIGRLIGSILGAIALVFVARWIWRRRP